MKEYYSMIIVLIVGMVLGASYMVWLDSGCELNGVMTWEGKVCFERLR